MQEKSFEQIGDASQRVVLHAYMTMQAARQRRYSAKGDENTRKLTARMCGEREEEHAGAE